MLTETTGTGTITLADGVVGFDTFVGSGIADGSTLSYVIQEGSEWEVGRGVYDQTAQTLTRSVIDSSSSGSALNLAGTADVAVTFLAEDIEDIDTGSIGINGASADATNKLALNSAASLFNHDGNGHQLKLNKAAAGDTASVLYQTGFSGRAEFGTTGDDDFHVKVSPDGSTWFEALVADKDTGAVSFPNGTDFTAAVSNRTALKALDTSINVSVYLTESGREGVFLFRSGDYSTEVTADTQEGVYIAADDTASSSGAWVRAYERLTPEMFGAVQGSASDQQTALQAFIDAHGLNEEMDFRGGVYSIAAQLSFSGKYQGCARNLDVSAIAGTWSGSGSYAVSITSQSFQLDNFVIRCNGLSDGITCDSFGIKISNGTVESPADEGIVQNAGAQVFENLLLSGFPEATALDDRTAARTNSGMVINANDAKLTNVISYQHLYQFDFTATGKTAMLTNCHAWEYDADDVIDTRTIRIQSGSTNNTFINCYLDSGTAIIEEGRQTFIGTKFVWDTTKTAADSIFEFVAVSASQSFSDFLYIYGNMSSLPGGVTLFSFSTDGGSHALSGFERGEVAALGVRSIYGGIDAIYSPEVSFPLATVTKIRFDPVAQSEAFSNEIFVNTTTGIPTFKTPTGALRTLGPASPTASAAEIADVANAINTADEKVAGMTVFDTTNNRIMVASGSAAASAWYVADGSASVTPA